MNYYIGAFKKYVTFAGRAQRQEFWMFELFNFIAYIILYVIGNALGTTILGTLYGLAVLLPSLAIGARRLHDRDMSGWFLLIGLIPVVGLIVLIVIFCMDGTPGDNRFGPNPKLVPAAA